MCPACAQQQVHRIPAAHWLLMPPHPPVLLHPTTSLSSSVPCRLQGYAGEYDDDIKDLQRRDLTPQQRMAAQVRGCLCFVWGKRMVGIRCYGGSGVTGGAGFPFHISSVDLPSPWSVAEAGRAAHPAWHHGWRSAAAGAHPRHSHQGAHNSWLCMHPTAFTCRAAGAVAAGLVDLQLRHDFGLP